MAALDSVDIGEISPLAWRLLRTAAGYEQRAVEREVDELTQAHVSMLESGSRGLSRSRRVALLELYAAELSDEQVAVLVEHF
jgi:transcriptional regulator with XRE-family HTH domain